MTHNDNRTAPGRLSVAVLGAGLIGIDLMTKIIRSDHLDLGLVVGRDEATSGLRQAARLGVPVAAGGIQSLVDAERPFDVVFDATSASSHAEHVEKLAPFGTMLIDLTPSRSGQMIFPTVNRADIAAHRDLSMVSCGGQAAVPILHAITRAHEIDYVEVVTTAATLSIGRGTRMNLDEYVDDHAGSGPLLHRGHGRQGDPQHQPRAAAGDLPGRHVHAGQGSHHGVVARAGDGSRGRGPFLRQGFRGEGVQRERRQGLRRRGGHVVRRPHPALRRAISTSSTPPRSWSPRVTRRTGSRWQAW